MKKALVFLLLAGMLLACLGANAESVPVTLDDVLTFARPDTLTLVELTDEDAMDGLCYAASSDELELYVYKLGMDGRTQEELFDEYLDDASLENVSRRTDGGMTIVTYYLSDEDAGAFIPTDNDVYYEFFFYFVTDDAKAAMETILASIAPV